MFAFMKNGTEKRNNGKTNGGAGAEQVNGLYFTAGRWAQQLRKIRAVI